MSEWGGLHNPERHSFWTTTIQGNVWCDCTAANCGPCAEHFPCRCCLAAEVAALTLRAEKAEAAIARVRDGVRRCSSESDSWGLHEVLAALDETEVTA